MVLEHSTDINGSTTNSEGIPYVESLTRAERRRGMFWRWRIDKKPEDRATTPIPESLRRKETPKGKAILPFHKQGI